LFDFVLTVYLKVVTGGHYDVDVELTDPMKNVLYKEVTTLIQIAQLVKAQVMLAAKSTKKNHQLGRNHDMLG
jgi:hypothetical protein